MARILIVTFGSLGDLHPAIGVGIELAARGHAAAIGTSESYRDRISSAGLGFRALRPNFSLDDEAVVGRIMDGTHGSEYLMRELVFPSVRTMHADMDAVAADCDLLVTAELVCAAPLVAARRKLPWAFFALSPISFFPLSDPPIMPGPAGSRWIQSLGPFANRLFKLGAKCVTYSWWRPLRQLRRELGLSAGRSPLFEGKFSPQLNLALFSPLLQLPQPDWPPHTVQTGFIFHDEENGASVDAALPAPVARFLAEGPPPIVFTLGSAAVVIARDFYAHAASAAALLGRRALLLVGRNPAPPNLPSTVMAWDYLPYRRIFPRASLVVHQGGVGTTAQVLRAGRPMVVIPFAHDQFDNAERMRRRGVAAVLPRTHVQPATLAAAIKAVLDHSPASAKAHACAAEMARENGAAAAAGALEGLLATSGRH